MPVEDLILEGHSEDSKTGGASHVPFTIDWKDAKMVRNHSVKATVREILNIAKSTGAVQVNLCGMPGQGKTTMARTIAHLVHKMSDKPFTVKRWGREQLLNIEEELNKLEPVNHVLIYDDISWLEANAPKQKVDQIIKTMTEIRHIKNIDVEIISILNFHYSYALRKSLRNSAFWFYFSIGSSELENVLKLVGVKNIKRVDEFRRVHHQAQNKKTFTYYAGKRHHTYQYRNPFAPCIFWNGDTLRHVVFPSREWIDPICENCLKGSAATIHQDVKGLDEFEKDLRFKFGIGIIRQTMRVKLLTEYGVNCYDNRVVSCMRYITEYLAKKQFNVEDLAERFGLSKTQTKRPSLPDGIEVIDPSVEVLNQSS